MSRINAPSLCRAHLQQVSRALHAYHKEYGSFPPAYVRDESGERLHSWRVLILPFLGHEDLYRRYRFDEPWDGPHNRLLTREMPAEYASPFAAGRPGVANFLAIVGRATAWPEQYGMRLEDVHDDPSLTIHVVESIDSDILWMEPRDISHQQALRKEVPVNYPTPSSARSDSVYESALVNGQVRTIGSGIRPALYASLLTISGGRWLDRGNWPPRADSGLELPPPRRAELFKTTDVLPHPNGRIVDGRNYVYCSTFEIAWEEAKKKFGKESLEFVEPAPLIDALNRHSFDRRNLSENAYIAHGGPGTDAFRGKIREEMGKKFLGSTAPSWGANPAGSEVLFYCYLLKSLPFGAEFDSLTVPLSFHVDDSQTDVASFGVRKLNDTDTRGKEMQAQVTILDYVSDDDFVVQLTPAGPRDEIVLAKVVPGESLEETVLEVRRRIADPAPEHRERRLFRNESLVVPKISASIERRYSEIEGRHLADKDLYIGSALQIIRFRLDEAGARLESEAMIEFDDGHPETPVGKRQLMFDRPFLIYLIERQADQPYFAAWIANIELLEPFSQ